ncbi:MAG: response regulator [Deltaproteobacteria bacterium]|nr:response regulator [Deltaproteobacteria bacterium]
MPVRSLADCNVLAVDDTEANLDILVDALGDICGVSVALDGPGALEAAAELRPDLILLDIMMPGMDGFEVLGRLRDDPATRGIPVIFITAMSQDEHELRGLEMGAADYITKPFVVPVLKARVVNALELIESRRRIAEVSENLSRYVSPQLYQAIFEGQAGANIGSHRKKLSIFFSDIVRFTETADNLEPEELAGLLNHYLNEMSEIALRHGGTIDKFMGDAILVFFGDPASLGAREDALACVSMALEMREAMAGLQRDWAAQGIQRPFQIRVGINTGFCTVGNFGSQRKMEYTVIGGQVNLAFRLQQAADPDQILIARETWSLVKDVVACRKRGVIKAKGIAQPVETYQVRDYRSKLGPEKGPFPLEELLEAWPTLAPEATLREVREALAGRPPFFALAVLEGELPVGLVSHARLGGDLAGKSYGETGWDQPVAAIMEREFLCVDAAASLREAAHRALERPEPRLHDPLVITWEGAYLGMLPLPRLLGALARE